VLKDNGIKANALYRLERVRVSKHFVIDCRFVQVFFNVLVFYAGNDDERTPYSLPVPIDEVNLIVFPIDFCNRVVQVTL